MSKSGVQRASASLQKGRIKVFDCRFQKRETREESFETGGLDFNAFLQALRKKFKIGSQERYVLATTDRTVLDCGNFAELKDGCTLYLLQKQDQPLPGAMEEEITFLPHFHTLTQSGMYEYYNSNGQNPLPYALAELIDNALSATAKNTSMRIIEIRMLFDETLGKSAVIILDNGCGMTSKRLNDWAVYRRSKFDWTITASKEDGYVRPDPVPRSLNSDISYFGVGGKQASFFIGDSAMMITKSVGSPDVHELVLSKEEFEEKEKNNENIYSGCIRNRKPGDSSHMNNNDEHFLHALIAEEPGKESFTAVVITGILPQHITFLKEEFMVWTRQLAHTFHYYIHGVNGNDMKSSSTNSGRPPNVEIQVTLQEKPPKCPHVMNLREVEDDMQTRYINTAADTFEFNISTDAGSGTVEGILRYHPFLYDKETYPEPDAMQAPDEVTLDESNEPGEETRATKRDIFECFWNGRLIPYTTISGFDWCTRPKVNAKLPEECYSRLSGVLFADDRFKVTINKLTFMELEVKLKSKDAIFTRIVNGQKQRGNMQTEFTKWLQNCHEKLDKQIKFLQYKETITRPELKRNQQYPWATFSSIEWDGKKYQAGQVVKSQKTNPIVYGTVVQFLLYGNHDRDIFATGGAVEVTLEPKALYDSNKIIPIAKIDRNATKDAIKKNIANDLARLPDKLKVDWPEGIPWPQNAVRPAGSPLGPIKVEIVNKKEETLSRMPSGGTGIVRKLSVELKLFWHDPKGDKKLLRCELAQHSPKWNFWFKKIENTAKLGRHTLSLSSMINDSKATVFGDKPLPSFELNFTIKEGSAESFTVGAVSTTLHVGVPFDIPLHIKDGYDHLTTPPPNLKPVLHCRGLDLSYEMVNSRGTTFTITSVRARGKVQNYQQSKTYELKVTLPGLKNDSQTLQISLMPGKPHCLHVTPQGDPVTVENRNPLSFNVEIHDEAGNITAHPKLIVRCQVQTLPPEAVDCSNTGAAKLVTKPINLQLFKGDPQRLKAQFDVPGLKNIPSVVRELVVLPSTRVHRMQLCRQDDEDLFLRNNEKIEWQAGGLLENMFYKLYDEAGREVAVTVDIAAAIKVNWTRDVNLDDLELGKLPEIHVPTQVQEERFYQVSYKDQSVSVAFIIKPCPDEAKRLKATLPLSSVKLGQTLPGQINLELVDQYDNVTKVLTSTCKDHITVEAEGLDKSAVVFSWQESSGSVAVSGLRFQSGTLGSREMCFTYRSYVASVIIKVTPGVPAQLKLISGPEQPLQVLNGHSIATPFLIQLCDEWGNPSPDQRVVVELKSSPPSLKVMSYITSQPVNAEGKASFSVRSVSGPKGYYQLGFEGSFNKEPKPIPGPTVNLTVVPDPSKPVSLSVEYDTNAKFPAGDVFPVFFVTVVSDEGSPITSFNPAAVSMFLWKGTHGGKGPPSTATELKCSKPKVNEKNGPFQFRKKDIPQQVGTYFIQFSLRVDRTNVLHSRKISINVVANQPNRLGPDSQPLPPVVSYTKAVAQRTLVKNTTLRIMDSYGNPAGQELSGRVMVYIKNSDDNRIKTLPLFENETNLSEFSLMEGKTQITNLKIMENSPGEDGSVYILFFKPEISMDEVPLASYELPFHFYNDVANQQVISELTKRKHELTEDVAAHESTLAIYRDLLRELTSQQQNASKKEVIIKTELGKKNITITNPVSIPKIDKLLNEGNNKAEVISTMPRRVCSIHDQFRGQQDVLGKIGHLAFVQDDDAARVISWHIRGEMDCVVTKTTAAAKRIFHDTRARQQVLPLDSMNEPQVSSSLPHIRYGSVLFDPPGNPVFARDLLIYTNDKPSCDIVFKHILGNIILMDDLDSGTDYRRAVVQHKIRCPTILTRQGDRISSIGKFGGTQNKAPPIETLQVFGAPLPQDYHNLKEQIDLLSQYRFALKKREDAEKELRDHKKDWTSPNMLKKLEEVNDKRKQLVEIERQLASMRPVKRAPTEAGEPSGILTKRTRQSFR